MKSHYLSQKILFLKLEKKDLFVLFILTLILYVCFKPFDYTEEEIEIPTTIVKDDGRNYTKNGKLFSGRSIIKNKSTLKKVMEIEYANGIIIEKVRFYPNGSLAYIIKYYDRNPIYSKSCRPNRTIASIFFEKDGKFYDYNWDENGFLFHKYTCTSYRTNCKSIDYFVEPLERLTCEYTEPQPSLNNFIAPNKESIGYW